MLQASILANCIEWAHKAWVGIPDLHVDLCVIEYGPKSKFDNILVILGNQTEENSKDSLFVLVYYLLASLLLSEEVAY